MLIYPLHYPTFQELQAPDNLTRAKTIYLSNLCKQYRCASFEQLQDLVLKPSSYFLFLLRFLGWCEVSRMHSQRNDWWKVRFKLKLNRSYSSTRFSSPWRKQIPNKFSHRQLIEKTAAVLLKLRILHYRELKHARFWDADGNRKRTFHLPGQWCLPDFCTNHL